MDNFHKILRFNIKISKSGKFFFGGGNFQNSMAINENIL